jgi:molecular chaperone GrpE
VTKEPQADSGAEDASNDVDEAGSAAAGPAGSAADAEPESADESIVDVKPVVSKSAPSVEQTSVEQDGNPEVDELRSGLDELTRDLQRVTAEYANYRKRVDRDRLLVAEQATGAVLTQLLPVLDDLDRARNHGDLVGPFAAVAEQLSAAMGKFGLTAFGDVGDPFDPTLHEAVAHTSSPDVTETACVEIMRRGYVLGDRLLRPALVAVADPE